MNNLFEETQEEKEVRLAEIARREALESRLSSLNDIRLAMECIGNKTPNIALFKLQIIDEDNTELLSSLEVADSELKAESEANAPILARSEEYSKLDTMLLEALAEQAEGRPEKMEEYLTLRANIKATYPKL